MKRLVIAAAVWLVCGTLNFGFTLGHLTSEYPMLSHTTIATEVAMVGPFGLPTALILNGPPYHWRVVPLTNEQRWEVFHKAYPHLSRELFDEDFH